MKKIGIIHYGIGNLQSVLNAFGRIDCKAEVITDPRQLKLMDMAVLPGVGAFGKGMDNLENGGWVPAIHKFVREEGKPFLGLCLGMQLLADWGDEDKMQRKGLSLIKGRVVRLDNTRLPVPHMGWNNIYLNQELQNLPFQDGSDFYFVHSFYFNALESKDVAAWCEYGIRFPSIVKKNNIWGVQFHPEKSHQSGLELLRTFVGQTC